MQHYGNSAMREDEVAVAALMPLQRKRQDARLSAWLLSVGKTLAPAWPLHPHLGPFLHIPNHLRSWHALRAATVIVGIRASTATGVPVAGQRLRLQLATAQLACRLASAWR